ncbi:MAG TPA: HNH endonuclease signature motif containing protein [Anaeromyxobacteraceae bacterium]|nr:HNH endonuclease signature motif containing protein [Anaeromyxobacteraceae bacterium]
MTAKTPSSLDSRTLARRLGELASDERQVQVEFLLHLDEFDRRRAYLELGYGSLWTYCQEVLHLREGPAGRRIAAMKVLRRFPRLAGALRDGRLCLTTLALLGQVLTEENAEGLVARAAFRTTAEVDHLVASLNPRSTPREGIRQLPAPVAGKGGSGVCGLLPVALSGASGEAGGLEPVGAMRAPAAEEASPAAGPARQEMRAVSQDLWSLRVTIDGACKDDLETLAMMLSHKFPRKDLAAVLHEAIRCGIEKHGKRQGAVKPARKTPEATPTKDPAAIPAELRRQVWERDGGCCAWVSPDGRRCGSRWQLQVDHVDPVGRGGRATIDRLRLLCKSHNLLYAEQVYGRDHMRRYRKVRFTDLAGSGGAVPMARQAMAAE